jgi:tetratricopeptide (TPR) repeat protein
LEQTTGYAAFISYNSADRTVAQKLQRALESYAIPKSLRGATTKFGAIGARLGKVCRDRTDFRSGESLNAALIEALDRSSALVVLCSPDSARSRWVNAEIEHFKQKGRSDRIFPVVARTGESGLITDTYPPALRRDDGDEAIAADLRPEGDGWQDGLLKVLASVLDVEFDALRQRALIAARRRMRIAYAVAGGATALAAAAVLSSIAAVDQRNLALTNFSGAITIARGAAQRTIELTDRTELPRAVVKRFLDETKGDLEALSSIRAMSGHPRLRLAAAEFQLLLSDLYSEIGRSSEQLEAAQAAERITSALAAAAADPVRRVRNAVVYGEQNAEFNVDILSANVESALARAFASNGDLRQARGHFERCRSARRRVIEEWVLSEEELRSFRNDALSCAAQEAGILSALGEPGAALALLQTEIDAVDTRDPPPATAYATIVLARLYADNGRMRDGIAALDGAIARRGDGALDGRQARMERAVLYETRARILALTGRIRSAVDDLGAADRLLADLLTNDPNDRAALMQRGELLATSGEVFALAGERERAERELAAALETFHALVRFDDARRDWRLARARAALTRSDNALRRFEDSPEDRDAIELAQSAARDAASDIATAASDDDEVAARLRLIAAVSLARALRLAGDVEAAQGTLDRAEAALIEDQFSSPAFTLLSAMLEDERGDLAATAHKKALASYDAAIARFDSYLAQEPAAVLAVRDLLWTLLSSAKSARAGGDLADARRRIERACGLKVRAGLGEYSLFVRDAGTLDEMAREIDVRC